MRTGFFIILILYLVVIIAFPSLAHSEQEKIQNKEDQIAGASDNREMEINNEEEKSEKEAEEENPFLRKFREIISEVEKTFPQFLEQQQEIYSKGIQGFLEQINPEFKYIPEGNEIQETQPVSSVPFHQPVIIAEQKILYIRIDGFTRENFKLLKEKCIEISQYARQPIGLIIDLRNSQTQTGGIIAVEYASLFTNHSVVNFVENPFKEIFKQPVIILIGSQTIGDAEIFASIMLKSGRSLLVGEKSAGAPFSTFQIKLKSGGTLIAPDIPTDLSWIKTQKLVPVIEIPAYPQIKYETISNELGSENSDQCIRRVCDLLVSIDAIQKEKRKSP